MREYRATGRYSHKRAPAVKAEHLCDNRPMPDVTAFEGDPDFVLSLARGLAVIEA